MNIFVHTVVHPNEILLKQQIYLSQAVEVSRTKKVRLPPFATSFQNLQLRMLNGIRATDQLATLKACSH